MITAEESVQNRPRDARRLQYLRRFAPPVLIEDASGEQRARLECAREGMRVGAEEEDPGARGCRDKSSKRGGYNRLLT